MNKECSISLIEHIYLCLDSIYTDLPVLGYSQYVYIIWFGLVWFGFMEYQPLSVI